MVFLQWLFAHTSPVALRSRQRNLPRPTNNLREALARLEQLTTTVSIVDARQSLGLPGNIRLEPKDQPILLAAIHGRADYLLTGDARHFDHLYGKRIKGVVVLRPTHYFERRRRA